MEHKKELNYLEAHRLDRQLVRSCMEKKTSFFLDLEQASSLHDGCLMQPLKLTVAPSGRRNNLLSKYSTLVIKVRMLLLSFLLTLSLPLQFFLQPFYPPVPLVFLIHMGVS